MTESPDTQHLSRKEHNTRIALIRSGVEAMTTHGYINTNIESILKKVGVPKD
jgi:TetR/AcrR family transcriptional regulator, transcriptional repressor for nem operon